MRLAGVTILVLNLLFFTYGTSRAIPLGECLRMAIEKRAVIKQHRFDVKASKEKERAAKAGFLPNFDVTYSATRSRTRGSYGSDSLGGFAGTSGNGTSGLGFPSSGFSGDLNETTSYSTFSATLSYNLFRGFSDYRSLRAARYSTSAQQFLLSAKVADIILNVRNAYLDALKAKSNLKVATDAVRLLKKQKADTDVKYQVGLINKRNLLKVQVELDSVRQDFLTASANFDKALDDLKRVVGIPYQGKIDVEDTSLPEVDTDNFGHLKDLLLQRRSEIKYYNMLIASLNEQKKSARGNFFPSIDLSLSYTKLGDDYTMKTRDEGMDYEANLMMQAKWNLFNGLRDYSGVRETLFRKMATEKELQEVKEQLILQLRHAIDDLKVARNRLKVAEVGVEEGKEHYRVTYESFRSGLADTTDLLDARVLLTRAESQQTDAFYDVQKARARLLRIIESDDKNKR